MHLYHAKTNIKDDEKAALEKKVTNAIAQLHHSRKKTRDGRGEIFIIDDHEPALVVKRFRRGGLVARLTSATYLGLSDHHSRMVVELRFLETLKHLALPVPAPVMAAVSRKFLFYGGYLVTEQIKNANTLTESLCRGPLQSEHWEKIGGTLRLFHDKQIFHADLNAGNIMIDKQGKVSLIDFDKSYKREHDTWKSDNLLRLKRSLEKIRRAEKEFHYREEDWTILMRAYDNQAN